MKPTKNKIFCVSFHQFTFKMPNWNLEEGFSMFKVPIWHLKENCQIILIFQFGISSWNHKERPNMKTSGAFIIEVNPLIPEWCDEYHVYTLNDRTLRHDTMGNYTAFQLNDRLAPKVLSPVRTSAEANDDCHLQSNTHARTTRSKSFEP